MVIVLLDTAIFAAPPWMPQSKALAMGLVLLGASVGSIITPILVQHVLVLHGFPWAVRIIAFIILSFLFSYLVNYVKLPTNEC